jgi:hypothetical protein
MPEFYLFQKAEVWYRAKVEARDETHALRLQNAGLVEGWEMLLDTVSNNGEIEVEEVKE